MKKGYYTGQIHLVKSHYEFTILTILQGEFDQCSSHPFHLYQKIENGKNRYVEAQSASQLRFKGHIWPIIHRLVITDKNGIFSYISLIFQKSNPVDAKFTVLALEPVGRT